MIIDSNQDLKIWVLTCSPGVGRPITAKIHVRSMSDYTNAIVLDMLDDISTILEAKGKETKICKCDGTIGSKGRIITPNRSRNTILHETWHREIRDMGFDQFYALGHCFVDESMAYSIGDSQFPEADVERRVEASESLFDFYRRAIDLSANGGLQQEDIKTMTSIIDGCGFKPSHHNWASFISCVDYLGVYFLCYRLIKKRGLDNAKQLFLQSLLIIEKGGGLIHGLDYLANALGDSSITLGPNIPLPREPGVGAPNSNKINHNYGKGQFYIGLWTTDTQIEKIIGRAYKNYKTRLDNHFSI